MPIKIESPSKITAAGNVPKVIEEVSKMFSTNKNLSDEELALHIIQKFNIDMDTIESMPAFQEKIKPLFGIEKEK